MDLAFYSIVFLAALFLGLSLLFFTGIWDKSIGKNRYIYLSSAEKLIKRRFQLAYGTLSLLLGLGFLAALISWFAFYAHLEDLALSWDFISRLLLMTALIGFFFYVAVLRARYYKH